MSTKLSKFRKRRGVKKLFHLNKSQIRGYDWGSKYFTASNNLSEKVIGLKQKEYWLTLDIQPISHIVDNISIELRKQKESQRIIPLIQYVYTASNSKKILKIVKKRLERKLKLYENKVIFREDM